MVKLEILNLAFTDMGGAGKASLVFNEMFNNAGHKSILVVKESREINKNVIVLPQKLSNHFVIFFRSQLRRLKSIISYYVLFKEKYFFFNKDENKAETTVEDIIKAIPFVPDVIVLHWVTGLVNSRIIYELGKTTNAKMFWIMMDNAPLTGGCHYTWDCKGFHNSCSNCPAIKLTTVKQIARSNLEIKKQYSSSNLEVICCSSDDHEKALSASIYKKSKIHKLLFPIDKEKFALGNKNVSRNNFSVPTGQKIIFYGASSLNNTRKGLVFFLKAISMLEVKIKESGGSFDSYVIFVAGTIDKSTFAKVKIPVVMLGFLNEAGLIDAYQASDVFVSTSIEDSGPLMVNQAIMTGTPVVSFNTGVAVDLVLPEVTGYLVELFDSKSLADNIYKILLMNDLEYSIVCNNCRQLAVAKYSFESSMKSYNALFGAES